MVSIARRSLDSFVKTGMVDPAAAPMDTYLKEKSGVFVTLSTPGSSGGSLRGCIGFPYPVKELGSALLEAAIAAASEDPRFPPVTPKELESVLVEVSILSKPQELRVERPQDFPSQIQIGKDGLIVSDTSHSGLLLPQVATDFGLGALNFLSVACTKAGLLPDSWLTNGLKMQKFQAEVFAEELPRGPIRRLSF
jgi:uncharacterized protein (TIGR00296 family)